MSTPPTLDEQRRAAQAALLDAGDDIEVGDPADAPWPIERLRALRGDEPEAIETHRGGLTAVVHRLRAGGRDWAIKVARGESLVRNADGRLAFVNELQRRADFARLKAEPGGDRRFAAIVDTTCGSLRHGLIVSPWLAGSAVAAWNERTLAQAIDALLACAEAGLFDWDPSPGNLVDDGTTVRLFDFGYLYRFDPLTQFNSAGHGDDHPGFHPAERFETRTYFAHLLQLERTGGEAAALAAFALEKRIALDAYRRHRGALAARHASAAVLARLDAIVSRWSVALAGDLRALYAAEGWRSHAADLDDDLGGRSCTPMTLRRADWLIDAATRLGDEPLAARYRALRREAEGWLVAPR